MLHCGGLVDALGPEQAGYLQEPESGQWRRRMGGYNKKNQYERTTPCDKDFLRKLAKDTPAQLLEDWFGGAVVQEYKQMEAFDKAGIFLIDGTYLFVPLDNEHYEGSSVLRFDEDNHPIDKETFETMSTQRQQRCRWRRCYRAVTLSHTTPDSDYSLRCGVKVMPGKDAESPQAWPLVKRFVEAAGRGVMKLLVFDKGFIDGATVSRLRTQLHVDSLFPLKKDMDLWKDAEVWPNRTADHGNAMTL